ncbi:oxysterol-binding protein-related protein 10 isoform X3 [Hyla sarda]|uniref:oxysterol-binding protein-related protein 10 isoform X3 n=1 Tax=Hyla sarda TaxID=327740 RepID=UPI0024C3A9E7|nr:oxysterol-binding protein-related protein 10 isoform X3 [Hyla sarda]
MDKAAQQHSGGGSSNSSSRSSSRATSAGSSPSSGARGLLAGPAGRLNQPQTVALAAAGKLDGATSREQQKQTIEGVLSKYTNLIQGWQNRYFILDFDSGILQYFITEASKTQKPRGSLSLAGSVISLSDEAPYMIVVNSASGEVYKLRAADSKERQFWLAPLQACAKHHTESKSSLSQRARSFSLLPHGSTNSSSPGSQRHLTHGTPSVVTITHHKSPAAARRSKNQNPAHLHEVKEAGPPEAEDELTDTEDNEEKDLGVMDDQRSVILHLISQLKLGMDLTKVVLPTFILEKRSLLEMYANFMAHPDMFLSIAAGTTPEERMICFVEYYLTAFHEGRKGAVAKKPYNPIIGETFHCSWDVPRNKVKPCRIHCASVQAKEMNTTQGSENESYKVRFVAEQVSHHPPVSCFYCECKEKMMCVNAHVWTKSKFLGMSVGVSMIGEGVLKLMEYGEEYVFTLPSAYARSILTVPWVELGGKVNITCAKTGYAATVTFHTKPFYGGKVHRVTAEVKHNPTNIIVCKAQGEWNGALEFTYNSGETKVIDTTKLSVIKKKIRPLEKQGPTESRRIWENVTNALKSDNIEVASEHKHQLEERQRAEARQRASTNTPWKPKYFIQEGDSWVYVSPL